MTSPSSPLLPGNTGRGFSRTADSLRCTPPRVEDCGSLAPRIGITLHEHIRSDLYRRVLAAMDSGCFLPGEGHPKRVTLLRL